MPPGWAVRELQLEAEVQQSIANDRLDLGTLRLERGVAVAGRVVEADGAPLRSRARLIAWYPSRSGSWTAMYAGRTVGFAEPGGTFALDGRFSAGPTGAWMLAAVSASGVGWATLEFAAGQEHLDPVDIRLLPGGSIDVQVTEAEGKPLANARVDARPHFQPIGLAPMWPASAGHAPALAEITALFVRTTDADGRAHFDNLPRKDHPSIRDANRDQPPGPAIIVSASLDGFVTNVATVNPAAAVTIVLSRQRCAALHGIIATKDGVPVPGVTVRHNGGPEVSAVSDGDGRYELPAHTYQGDRAYLLVEGGDVPLMRLDFDLPAAGDRIHNDIVVELRSPAHGRVVDQHGAPVAGVELHLGVLNGMHYRSTPQSTGADGVFAFPDAVASHVDLWVRPPEPRTAWRIEQSRTLTRRDGEVVTLHRLEGPFVDLMLAITDGRTGAPVSPTAVDVYRLHGSTRAFGMPFLEPALTLGAASVPHLPPGTYRAIVHAAGGLRAEHDFTLPADAGTRTERVHAWPPATMTCTVDASALSSGDLAARSGEAVIAVLDAQDETSQAIDANGVRLNYTENTGIVHFGGDMTFRLAGVTPNVARRLRVLHKDLFGEAWFTAAPGADVQVTLRVIPAGRLAFTAPAAWPTGNIELDVHDGSAWRTVLDWQHGGPNTVPDDPNSLPRAPGETRWRVRLWPADGGPTLDRSGTSTIAPARTTTVHLTAN